MVGKQISASLFMVQHTSYSYRFRLHCQDRSLKCCRHIMSLSSRCYSYAPKLARKNSMLDNEFCFVSTAKSYTSFNVFLLFSSFMLDFESKIDRPCSSLFTLAVQEFANKRQTCAFRAIDTGVTTPDCDDVACVDFAVKSPALGVFGHQLDAVDEDAEFAFSSDNAVKTVHFGPVLACCFCRFDAGSVKHDCKGATWDAGVFLIMPGYGVVGSATKGSLNAFQGDGDIGERVGCRYEAT